jgi:hypothetical protein
MPRRRNALTRSYELSLAAPAVIAMRSARMMAAGTTPTAADRKEMSRMVTEKVGAFAESWSAMTARQQRAQLDAWMQLMRWSWTACMRGPSAFAAPAAQRRMQRAQAAVLASGLAPLHRVATANLRRLSRDRTGK